MSPEKQIQSYAFEDKVYYLHQRGHMFRHLKALNENKSGQPQKSFDRFKRGVKDPIPLA